MTRSRRLDHFGERRAALGGRSGGGFDVVHAIGRKRVDRAELVKKTPLRQAVGRQEQASGLLISRFEYP